MNPNNVLWIYIVLLVIGAKDGYVERDGQLVDPEKDIERRRAFGG